MKNNDAQFEQIYKKAWAAGVEAAAAAVPEPMTLTDGKRNYFISEGACGFAWVKIRPANSAFAKWLKRVGKVRNVSYSGGYDIWISDYNQSMARKEAHADAMAKVLKEAGITAYAQSRMD